MTDWNSLAKILKAGVHVPYVTKDTFALDYLRKDLSLKSKCSLKCLRLISLNLWCIIQCEMCKQKSFQGAVSPGRDSSIFFAVPGFIALWVCLFTCSGIYLVPDLASALQFAAANALLIKEGEQNGKVCKRLGCSSGENYICREAIIVSFSSYCFSELRPTLQGHEGKVNLK